jgi:hypothetical protein
MSSRSDLVTRSVAGTNNKRKQAPYIKERIHVAQIGSYNCYRLFINGSGLTRGRRTDYFRQKLWPGEIAANGSQLKATPAGRLSSFAFDIPGPQAVEVIQGSDANGRYQGGPHPR